MTESYKTDNIIIATGDDFAYYYAEETFEFVRQFGEIMFEKSGGMFEFEFSTVQRYMDAVKHEIKEKNIKLKEHTGDFLPLNMQY